MTDVHIGERAELYALGLLDLEESAEVDAHAAYCPQCLRQLGEAEETVLHLERGAEPLRRRPHLPAAWIAVAAAFLIGLLPYAASLVREGAASPADATHNAAVLAMVGSHFQHAQFVAAVPGAPRAKAIYARDGAWLYVIVAGTHPYLVAGDGKPLGSTRRAGATSELFIRPTLPLHAVVLRDGGRIVARARL